MKRTLIMMMLAGNAMAEDFEIANRVDFSRIPVDTFNKTHTWERATFTNVVTWFTFDLSEFPQPDYSTNHNDVAQATAGFRPLFTNSGGGCFQYDGVDDRFETNNTDSLDSPATTSNLTIMAWIKPPSNFSGVNNRMVATSGAITGTGAGRGYEIIVRVAPTPFGTTSNNFSICSQTSGGSVQCANGINAPVKFDDTWQHIAGVIDNDTKAARAYYNGVQNSTNVVIGDVVFSTDVDFRIGLPNAGSPRQPFIGLIDDVIILNRKLTNAEIQAYYDRTVGVHQ